METAASKLTPVALIAENLVLTRSMALYVQMISLLMLMCVHTLSSMSMFLYRGVIVLH